MLSAETTLLQQLKGSPQVLSEEQLKSEEFSVLLQGGCVKLKKTRNAENIAYITRKGLQEATTEDAASNSVESLLHGLGFDTLKEAEDEMQQHIRKLHKYNEIKDMAQILIGKLAESKGKTVKEIYAELDLDLSL